MAEPERGKGVHDGHRGRVKRQFLDHGGAHMEEHQILELILFYAIPRRDVNPLAHQLIDRFGSLRSVLDAPESELKRIVGVSDNVVALLKLFPEMSRRYCMAESEGVEIVTSTEEAARILQPRFVGAQEEQVYLLCTDAKGKLLGCQRISQGAVDAVLLDQRRIVEKALHWRASQIYLAHCHVNGLAIPSEADVSSTRRLAHVFRSLGIRLNDHLIFADGDYISMAQSGLID